ncbi:gamma-glutamyltransferase [Phreatobacter sp.]|uniref:gamma-glutamyltransferase n=1 Tax=Phreatobacter sp. TaxID=1966341 RepID=UPI003F6E48DC
MTFQMRNFYQPGRSSAYATEAMAATSHPLATAAALDILKAGGTAADAAIAAVGVMAVVEPHMTGIGGDCFALISRPGKPIWGYNGSGRAPKAASAAALRAEGLTGIAPDSVHSVTVPGAIEAWETILGTHGRFDLGRVLEPAIRYAREGWPVTPRVAYDWPADAEALGRDAGASRHYLLDGRPPRMGERMASPALAATLQEIAARGAKGFYEGRIAEDIVRTVTAKGGRMALEDLASHHGTVETPVIGSYKGTGVVELPPNGQGITALIILNILECFDIAGMDPLSPERLHLEVEAARIAYSLRDAHVADPAHMRHSVEELTDKGFARKLATMIDPKRRTPRLIPPPPGTNTIYCTIVDRDRMAVSFINSLFHHFGSKICTPDTGILLQNRGCSFNLDDAHPNCYGPGKRPMHTIIPAMLVEDGEVTCSFGVMGGSYQSSGHARVVCALVEDGMDPQAAIDLPRAFFEGEKTTVEPTWPEATISAMRDMGHEVLVAAKPIGGGQMIRIEKSGFLVGGSDARKDGLALGY